MQRLSCLGLAFQVLFHTPFHTPFHTRFNPLKTGVFHTVADVFHTSFHTRFNAAGCK